MWCTPKLCSGVWISRKWSCECLDSLQIICKHDNAIIRPHISSYFIIILIIIISVNHKPHHRHCHHPDHQNHWHSRPWSTARVMITRASTHLFPSTKQRINETNSRYHLVVPGYAGSSWLGPWRGPNGGNASEEHQGPVCWPVPKVEPLLQLLPVLSNGTCDGDDSDG